MVRLSSDVKENAGSIMHMQRKSHSKPPVPLVHDAGKCGVTHASLEMQTEAAAEKGRSWT